jgi:hypothetical protein
VGNNVNPQILTILFCFHNVHNFSLSFSIQVRIKEFIKNDKPEYYPLNASNFNVVKIGNLIDTKNTKARVVGLKKLPSTTMDFLYEEAATTTGMEFLSTFITCTI